MVDLVFAVGATALTGLAVMVAAFAAVTVAHIVAARLQARSIADRFPAKKDEAP